MKTETNDNEQFFDEIVEKLQAEKLSFVLIIRTGTNTIRTGIDCDVYELEHIDNAFRDAMVRQAKDLVHELVKKM